MNLIVNAVQNKQLLLFKYDDLVRLVEPHAVGHNKKGDVVLRGFQTGGQSASGGLGWKLFNMTKAEDLSVDYKTFEAPRDGYTKGDRAMSAILAEL